MSRRLLVAIAALGLGACLTTQQGVDLGPAPNQAVLNGETGQDTSSA